MRCPARFVAAVVASKMLYATRLESKEMRP